MSGDEGADILIGTIGFQLLRGGTGDDALSGGADADRFEFGDGWGNDRITDFEIGLDRIDMSGVNGLTMHLQLAITDGPQGAQVAFAGQVLTLAGVVAGALTEDDFML
jgi:Ca2+-binding RTX toxin-like protein